MPDRDSCSLPRALVATLLVAVVALAGCKNNPNRDLENPDDAYRMAKDDMSRNNYVRSVFIFEQMEARFPFANATKQSQLDLMYAYFKNREP